MDFGEIFTIWAVESRAAWPTLRKCRTCYAMPCHAQCTIIVINHPFNPTNNPSIFYSILIILSFFFCSLLAATRAERDPITDQYTDCASKAVDDVAGCIRLFSILTWANFRKEYGVLLTPKGLSRMKSRGHMTRAQYVCLVSNLSNPNNFCPSQDTAMQWIYVRLLQGMKEGAFPNTHAMEEACTHNTLRLRGTIGTISDAIDAKIPLAYAQFVQIVVDTFLLISPFGLYPELGLWR